jgi:DNA-binding NarL/FixJ family response regulator
MSAIAEPRARFDGSALPVVAGLCSDDQLDGRRIAAALTRADLGFVGPGRTVTELVTEASQGGSSVDVVILGSSTSRAEHLCEVKRLRHELPEVSIVSVRPSAEREARRLLQHGVEGLVDESAIEETLAATVMAVRSGQVCAPRRVRAQLNGDALSAREKQVLGMVVMGCTNAEIALRLHLAESTVKSHLSSSFDKLGVRSRKEAAALILDPEEGLGPGILTLAAG